MTEILLQIRAVLEENGTIRYLVGQHMPNYGGNYYGIYKHKKCLYAAHYFEKNFIAVLTPRRLYPEEIKATYGIECEGDPGNFTSYTSRTHYGIKIPLLNGLLNGQFSIADKRDFFIKITKMR